MFGLQFNTMEEALLTITEEEMNSLTQSILVRYGIDFTCYERKSLKRRVISVLNVYNRAAIGVLGVKLLRDKIFI